MARRRTGLLLLCAALGCDEGGKTGTPREDASVANDASVETDAGHVPDAGLEDAGPADSGLSDASFDDAGLEDAGLEDAAMPPRFGMDQRPVNRTCVAPASPSALPALLSQTGCVKSDAPREALSAMVPYDVRVPFWSDGAEKTRWLAIPDGAVIEVAADGDLILPPGSVTMKRFELAGVTVETRFFVRFQDGSYGGYGYRWNDAGTDATLIDGAETRVVDDTHEWSFPARADCATCHLAEAGGHLGLETMQLDREFAYPSGITSNQLDTLAHIGFLTRPGGLPKPLTPPGDQASLTARARSYLHANCAYCHRPGAPGGGLLDMRAQADDPGLCNAAPLEGDLGIRDALLVYPGEPDKSLVYLRMARRGEAQMPPLSSHQVDEAGAALVRDWIASLRNCRSE